MKIVTIGQVTLDNRAARRGVPAADWLIAGYPATTKIKPKPQFKL
jgi:hypothetical protein